MPRTRGDCVAARGAALGSNYSSAIARYGREQGASVAWALRGRGYFGAVGGVAGRVPPGGGCDEDRSCKIYRKMCDHFSQFYIPT